MNKNTEIFGFVTRVDDGFIYIWSPTHRLTETMIHKHFYPEITPGDVVQYKLTDSINGIQQEPDLRKILNHDLTILYPPQDNSQFRVRTSILFPPADSDFYEKQYTLKFKTKIKFVAFSLEFGTVVSFVDLKHEPGKAYRGYIGRLPPNYDVLIKYIDTIFCVVDAELKEIVSERELENIKNRAPWNNSNNNQQTNKLCDFQNTQKVNLSLSETPGSLILDGNSVKWSEPIGDYDSDFDENDNPDLLKLKLKKQVSWSEPIDNTSFISIAEKIVNSAQTPIFYPQTIPKNDSQIDLFNFTSTETKFDEFSKINDQNLNISSKNFFDKFPMKSADIDYSPNLQNSNQFKTTNNLINQKNCDNDLIDLVKNQNYSNKTNTNFIFDEFKQTNLAPHFNEELFDYSVKLNNQKINHSYDLSKNNLTESQFVSPNKNNFSLINLSGYKEEINTKKSIYDNYYNSFQSNINLETKNHSFYTGLEESNHSNEVQSLQCVAAVICYKKTNYALVYSPVTQSLVILLKSSFSEFDGYFEQHCQIGHWVEGADTLIDSSLLEDINLPGFAKTIKYQFIRPKILKLPRYPTRIVRKICQEIGTFDSKPSTCSCLQVKICIDLENIVRNECVNSIHSYILNNTPLGNVLVNGHTPLLDSTEGTIHLWIGFMASAISKCHWKVIAENAHFDF